MEPPVTLREVTDADLPTLFAHQADPEAFRMAAVAPRDKDDFIEHWAKVWRDTTNLARAVVADGAVVGYVCSFEQGGNLQVGYWIGKDFWGRGLATQALAAFLPVETRRPLHAHVAQDNIASVRVLEKCGFVRVGTEEAVSVRGGPAVDEYVYALER